MNEFTITLNATYQKGLYKNEPKRFSRNFSLLPTSETPIIRSHHWFGVIPACKTWPGSPKIHGIVCPCMIRTVVLNEIRKIDDVTFTKWNGVALRWNPAEWQVCLFMPSVNDWGHLVKVLWSNTPDAPLHLISPPVWKIDKTSVHLIQPRTWRDCKRSLTSPDDFTLKLTSKHTTSELRRWKHTIMIWGRNNASAY